LFNPIKWLKLKNKKLYWQKEAQYCQPYLDLFYQAQDITEQLRKIVLEKRKQYMERYPPIDK